MNFREDNSLDRRARAAGGNRHGCSCHPPGDAAPPDSGDVGEKIVHLLSEVYSAVVDLGQRLGRMEHRLRVPRPAARDLSPREREIHALREKGYRIKEIASHLGVKESTVKNTESRVRRKAQTGPLRPER